jgi:hypothetical protein
MYNSIILEGNNWPASRLIYFTQGETTIGMLLTGSWMNPRASPGVTEETNIGCLKKSFTMVF